MFDASRSARSQLSHGLFLTCVDVSIKMAERAERQLPLAGRKGGAAAQPRHNPACERLAVPNTKEARERDAKQQQWDGGWAGGPSGLAKAKAATSHKGGKK